MPPPRSSVELPLTVVFKSRRSPPLPSHTGGGVSRDEAGDDGHGRGFVGDAAAALARPVVGDGHADQDHVAQAHVGDGAAGGKSGVSGQHDVAQRHARRGGKNVVEAGAHDAGSAPAGKTVPNRDTTDLRRRVWPAERERDHSIHGAPVDDRFAGTRPDDGHSVRDVQVTRGGELLAGAADGETIDAAWYHDPVRPW